MEIKSMIVSSMEKVRGAATPSSKGIGKTIKVFKGETVSFQVAYYLDYRKLLWGQVNVESPIKEMIKVRTVVNVPCENPTVPSCDEGYLVTEPSMMPDLLREIKDDTVPVQNYKWRSLWVDVEIPGDAKSGEYTVTISISCNYREEKVTTEETITVSILDAVLPKLSIPHTEWFYADCIADYYKVSVLSEEFWDYVRKFVHCATHRGINTILTPIFTYALDTGVGLERTTVQLIEVTVDSDEKYSFDFTNLDRWVQMCLEEGVEYFEMAHLFTQWGCEHAPKVMAKVDGEYKRIFGWEDDSFGDRYLGFLRQLLPELRKELIALGIKDRSFLHLSDEPHSDHCENYERCNALVRECISDIPILDALSEYEFYRRGLVDRPACATNRMENYLGHDVPNLWAYYCGVQVTESPNRFIAQPSSRNRILGVLLYKYDCKGFLHWGFNFYNCMYSYHHINPYLTTDAEGAVVAGDPFVVYPGENGVPEESLRLMVLDEAFNDFRALKLLESLSSREEALSLLNEDLTFKNYPWDNDYILGVRERINNRIEELL